MRIKAILRAICRRIKLEEYIVILDQVEWRRAGFTMKTLEQRISYLFKNGKYLVGI